MGWETWTAEDLLAEITNENSQDSSLKIHIRTNIDDVNVLSDVSGHKNLGFAISDKKINFREGTASVEKTKNFDRLRRTKKDGAF